MKIFRLCNLYGLDFYHGTSNKAFILGYEGDVKNPQYSISKFGLEYPFLTSDIDMAKYYAELTSENDGDYRSYPLVLKVKNLDESLLRLDKYSMDEPIMSSEEKRDREWDQAAKDHPEWYDAENDLISIPEEEWGISYNAVGAVKYNGIIPFSDLEVVWEGNEKNN